MHLSASGGQRRMLRLFGVRRPSFSSQRGLRLPTRREPNCCIVSSRIRCNVGTPCSMEPDSPTTCNVRVSMECTTAARNGRMFHVMLRVYGIVLQLPWSHGMKCLVECTTYSEHKGFGCIEMYLLRRGGAHRLLSCTAVAVDVSSSETKTFDPFDLPNLGL